jgi:MFS family permease
MLKRLYLANPRGWLVVLFAFLALSLAFSARYTIGVLIPVWEAEFGWTRGFISSGASLGLLVMAAVAPPIGNMIDRFSPGVMFGGGMLVIAVGVTAAASMTAGWQFILIYCVFAAIGYGVIGLPLASTVIARHFTENRGFATSVGSSGVGAGQLVLIPVFAALVGLIGWRGSLQLTGLVVGAFGILCLFVLRDRRSPEERRAASAKRRADAGDRFLVKLSVILRHPVFWLVGLAYMVCGFTTAGIVKVHLLPYAAACGFPLVESAAAFGVMAAFDSVGMLLAGYLTDRMHRPFLLGMVYFLRALTFILLLYVAQDVSLLFFFAVLFGVLDFATVPPMASIVASHIGLRTMGLAMGTLFAMHSIGAATGAWLGGWLFDLNARYDWVWIIGLALALLAAVLVWMVPEKPRYEPKTASPAAA